MNPAWSTKLIARRVREIGEYTATALRYEDGWAYVIRQGGPLDTLHVIDRGWGYKTIDLAIEEADKMLEHLTR